jgi:hypothetical protein
MADFIRDNTEWSQTHPEDAEKIRTAKLAAEDAGTLTDTTQAEAKVAGEVAKVEGEPAKPEEAKPAEAAAAAATPALIDAWKTDSPELAAAFEKYPEKYQQIMETARAAEAAKPVLDIVSTPEEAQFAVDHAQRLVSLQTNIMLAGDDPEQMGSAWGQVEEMFKERDANGAEVKGADGKPVLGSDFKPFVRKAASVALGDYAQAAQAEIAAIEARLKGVYPSEDAKTADATALQEASYAKMAFDFVIAKLGQNEEAPKLPALPANATAEQIEFQKKLEAQQKDLDAKQGRQTSESRKAATRALDGEVQKHFEAGVNRGVEAHIAAMKERGEYLPDFVLNDKYINPVTQQPTKISAFSAKIYMALNNKINGNPLHVAKLGSLQALGAAGKESRLAEITRLTGLYMPKIIEAEVTRIQDGIRASSGQKTVDPSKGVARVEPQSAGTVVPAAMDSTQIRQWAETEAAKDPNWGAMDQRTREQLVITTAAKKRYGG